MNEKEAFKSSKLVHSTSLSKCLSSFMFTGIPIVNSINHDNTGLLTKILYSNQMNGLTKNAGRLKQLI